MTIHCLLWGAPAYATGLGRYVCSACGEPLAVLPARSPARSEELRTRDTSPDAQLLVDAASTWALFTGRLFLGMAMRWTAHPNLFGRDLLAFFYLTLAMFIVVMVLVAMGEGLITVRTVEFGLVGLAIGVVGLCIFGLLHAGRR